MAGLFDDIIDNVGEPFKGGKGFEYGTHEVIIGEVEATEKDVKATKGAPIINITVADPDDGDKTAICTLYFHTEGGAQMAVAKVLGILVHNVGEEKKDTVRNLGRKLFADIKDLAEARDVAAKLLTDKMIGKKAFLVAEPQGKYKTTSYGDIWHYAAKPQGEPEDEAQKVAKDVGGSVVDNSDLPDDLDI
ncbi:MAG TPA: hypothetical protein VD907_07050 [Verrucomicrobiae bacterium]|nr:hypothetical protein [Verrucomicrobiae bacterium]